MIQWLVTIARLPPMPKSNLSSDRDLKLKLVKLELLVIVG